MPLTLVSDHPQEILPCLDISFGLHTFRRKSVDDSKYAAPLVSYSQNHLHRICSGTEDTANFGTCLNRIQDVYRESVLQENDKCMSGARIGCIFGGNFLEIIIVAFHPYQAGPRSLAK